MHLNMIYLATEAYSNSVVCDVLCRCVSGVHLISPPGAAKYPQRTLHLNRPQRPEFVPLIRLSLLNLISSWLRW